MPRRSHALVVGVAAVYGLALVAIGLWPQHIDENLGLNAHPWYGVLEFVANVALFVPFGALATPRVPRIWVVLSGFVLSGVVELVQHLLLPGRTGSVQDVVANTLGAVVGAGLLAWGRRRLAGERASS